MNWPLTKTLLPLLQHKWTFAILEDIRVYPRRVAEIRTGLGVSGKVLQQSMQYLVDQDVVCRRAVSSQPPGVAYELTDRGRQLVELLDRLDEVCADRLRPSRAIADVAESDQTHPMSGVFGSSPAVDGPLAEPRSLLGSPNVARMYDYYLGGKNNFNVDRDAADKVIQVSPFAPAQAVANRRFLMRALSYLVDHGIEQFIDIGSGLPTQQNVHEVVRRLDAHARVVYVDNDPVVLAHARALLCETPETTIIEGDMRDPGTILDNPALRARVDFSRPVGVLLVSVLHCLTDEDDPWSIAARLRDRSVAGSYIAVSHICHQEQREAADAGAQIYRDLKASTPMISRDIPAVRALFTGLDIVEPGVTWLAEWHPELSAPELSTPWPGQGKLPHTQLCGVGRVPGAIGR